MTRSPAGPSTWWPPARPLSGSSASPSSTNAVAQASFNIQEQFKQRYDYQRQLVDNVIAKDNVITKGSAPLSFPIEGFTFNNIKVSDKKHSYKAQKSGYQSFGFNGAFMYGLRAATGGSENSSTRYFADYANRFTFRLICCSSFTFIVARSFDSSIIYTLYLPICGGIRT